MSTARFSIPLLQVGQAQKEVTHNEGMQALELCVQPVVEGAPINQPPQAPEKGQQFLVGNNPIGAFAGKAAQLVSWTEAGWLFTNVQERFAAVDRTSGLRWTFEKGAWTTGIVRAKQVEIEGKTVLGSQQPAIAAPVGGQVVDQDARTTLGSILSALRQHGLIAS